MSEPTPDPLPEHVDSPNLIATVIRMDRSLHAAIKASAERNDRTMAAEIRHAMREHLR